MALNDREAALLATAVYYEKPYKEMRDKNIPAGWEKKDVAEHSESGFLCVLFVKVITCLCAVRLNAQNLRAFGRLGEESANYNCLARHPLPRATFLADCMSALQFVM